MARHAEESDLPMLRRHLAAMRVSVLADAGRVDEALRHWREAALPDEDAGCLDLERQSWREMEAVASARLRVLLGDGDIAGGRRFACRLGEVAAGRGLRRTWMRALALALVVEERAGDRQAAARCMAEYLRLFAQTDYARPMARYPETVTAVAESMFDQAEDPVLRRSVLVLRRAVDRERRRRCRA